MKLLYFKGKYPNFGDELNTWLFPKLLPGFFDEDESEVFVGIGSIIGADFIQRYGRSARKIVFGAGFVASYHAMPDLKGPDWKVYFVRGPRTAHALNIPASLALGDAAILLRSVVNTKTRTGEIVSFMPHWESMEHGHWSEACTLAGIHLIDPRRPVEEVISDILRSKVVLAEAMHGAIVADALRVPWIPLVPINRLHREKWYDWAEALSMDLRPHRMFSSSLTEARLSFLRKPIVASPLAALAETALTHMAAFRLDQLTKRQPCLSNEKVMERAYGAMLEQLRLLQQTKNSSQHRTVASI